MIKKSTFVPLARVLRPHGYPKNHIKSYKAELFNSGGLLFKDLQSCFVAKSAEASFVEVELVQTPSPLSGSWGQARFVILSVAEDLDLEPGYIVALKRESFPKLNDDEFYLCDLLDREVHNESGKVVGRIVGFEENTKENLNIVAKSSDSDEEFSFPLRWVDFSLLKDRVVVPGVEDWMELK